MKVYKCLGIPRGVRVTKILEFETDWESFGKHGTLRSVPWLNETISICKACFMGGKVHLIHRKMQYLFQE